MNDYYELVNNYYYIPSVKKFAEKKCAEADYRELEKYIEQCEKTPNRALFTEPKKLFPVEISLFPSVCCSMHCSYCYYCSGENTESDLSKEDLDTIISFLIKNAKIRKLAGKNSTIRVTLTGGGEPTFNWKNFTYFVDTLRQEVSEKGLDVEFFLVTNGVLSEEKLDYLCEKIDEIQISYDGNSELQNANRKLVNGEKSAELVEKTMEELSKRKKGFYVRSTVHPCDFNKIMDMTIGIFERYEYAISYHIEPVQYTGRGEAATRDTGVDNAVLIEEYVKTKEEVLKRFPERCFRCSLFDYKDVCVSCSSITGETPVIDNQGRLFPCSDRLDPVTQSLGKIENGKIVFERESFYKEQYNKLLMTECGNCPFFSLCGGGCFSTFKRDNEGELLPEGKAKCELVKEYWMNAYNQLAEKQAFLEMKLAPVARLKDWNIYEICVD